MDYDQLYHHGIKGMKWGIRRFQRKDGSRTPAGRKRYGDGPEHDSDSESRSVKPRPTRKKSVREMTDAELNAAIERRRLEQRYAELNPEKVSLGKKFTDAVIKDIVVPSATNVAKNLMTDVLTKQGKKFLGLDDADAKYISDLSDQVKKLKKEKELKELLEERKKSKDTLDHSSKSKSKSKNDDDDDDDRDKDDEEEEED